MEEDIRQFFNPATSFIDTHLLLELTVHHIKLESKK